MDDQRQFTPFTKLLPPDGATVTVRAIFASDQFKPRDMTFHVNWWGENDHALLDANGRWFWYPDFTEWRLCADQPIPPTTEELFSDPG